jgi:hypothetical protein
VRIARVNGRNYQVVNSATVDGLRLASSGSRRNKRAM